MDDMHTTKMTARQREQLVAAIEKAGPKGLTESELGIVLLWPADSVLHWLTSALEAGEIAVAPGEADLPATDRHYVTIETWRNAADGDLGR